MTGRKSAVFGILLLLGAAAVAQEYPKAELALDYSYMHFAPAQAETNNKSLNGGGGAFVYNLAQHFGIKADLQGYNSFTDSFNIPASASLPSGAHGNVSGNLFTYLFGPQIKFRGQHVQLLLNALAGAAHSNVYGSAFKTICQPTATGCPGISASPSNNAWATMLGGGLDFPINHVVSIRAAEVDYLLTRFGNFFTKQNANQNNFRYTGGLNFNFGGTAPVAPTASCSGGGAEVLPDDPPVSASVSPNDFNPKHPLTYAWQSTGGRVSGDGSSAKVDVTGVDPGTYQVSSTVSDPKQKKNNVASCSTSFTVKKPQAPIVSCSATPNRIVAGAATPVTIAVNGSTPDPRPIQSRKFSTTAGSIQEGQTSAGSEAGAWNSSATLDTNGVQPGSIDVNVAVTDSRGLSSNCLASVAVDPAPAPPAPTISELSQCDFTNAKKPARVDNSCKANLDGAALQLQHDPQGKVVIVGFANSDEESGGQQVGALRAVNAKSYLTAGEGGQGVDASRVDVRKGSGEGQKAVLYWVPAGANASVDGTSDIDESQVKAQTQTTGKKRTQQ
jgi:outer membrane protein OmpA-like peptidoglycan-associated protein